MKVAKTKLTVVEHGSTTGHKEGELAMAMIRKEFLRQWGWIAMFAVGLMAMALTACESRRVGLTVRPAPEPELVWEQIGPEGGNITALLATPDGTLYAGMRASPGELPNIGVWRLENGSNSWVGIGLVNTPGMGGSVTSLAIMGTALYAGTENGVFRLDAGDKTWTAVNTGLLNPFQLPNFPPRFLSVTSLTVMRTTLYAGTENGIFRSDNRGDTWTPVSAGLPQTEVSGGTFTATATHRYTYRTIRVSALAVMGTTLYVGTGDRVFRSDNGGNTWTAVNTGLMNSSITLLAVMETTLYAGTLGGIFRSENGGNKWTQVNKGLTNTHVRSLASFGTALFVGTDSGVFRSEDEGDTWTNRGLTDLTVNSLAIIDTTLYAATDNGVFRSEDGGETWTPINTGLTNCHVHSLAFWGTTLYASTDHGVFRSKDGGNTWMRDNKGLEHFDVMVAFGTILYAGTAYGVFRSEDGGDTWTKINTGLGKRISPQYSIPFDVESLAVMGTTLYAGTTDDGVFRSEDRGNTWTPVKTGLPQVVRVLSLAVMGTTLYAGTTISGGDTTGGSVFRLEAGTNRWTEVNTGLTSHAFSTLAVIGTTLYAGTWGGGIFLSHNGGNTWTPAFGLTRYTITSFAVMDTILYAGTRSGVFHEQARINPWKPVNTGLKDTDVFSLAVDGTTLYAGTNGNGVFRASLSK